MVVRAFLAVRKWELARGIANVYSLAFSLFGIVLPAVVVVPVGFYFEQEMRAVHQDFFIWLLFGSIAFCYAFFWWQDKD